MSNLRKLTVSQFNAAVNRGVKQREEKIPSNLRAIARKIVAGMSAPTGSKSQSSLIAQVDKDKQRRIKDLADYQSRMDKMRRSLLKIGKDASLDEYRNAGLPLVNKDAIKEYVPQ